MADPFWIFSLILAAGLAALYARQLFARPGWVRSFTSFTRFHLAAAVFVVTYVLMYLLIYLILRGAVDLIADVGPEEVLSPVWLALAITLLLPTIRPVAAWLHTLRCRLAHSPTYAHRLAKALHGAEFEIDATLDADTRDMLRTRGIDIDVDEDWMPPVAETNERLRRAAALFVRLSGWIDDPQYAPFMREAQNDVSVLRNRFESLTVNLVRTYAVLEHLGEIRGFCVAAGMKSGMEDVRQSEDEETSLTLTVDNTIRKIAGALISERREEIRAFHHEACLMVARCASASTISSERRFARFRDLGFVMEHPPGGEGYKVLGVAAAILYLGLLIFFLLLGPQGSSMPTHARVVVITLIVFCAISVAVVPKLHWAFASGGLRAQTPVKFVICAAVCALLISLIINLVAGAIVFGGWHGDVYTGRWAGALKRLHESVAFLPGPVATAAAMAWLVQDHRWLQVNSARVRRVMDALTLGAVWAGLTLIAVAITWYRGVNVFNDLEVRAIVSYVFGAVLGSVVPETIRSEAVRAVVRRSVTMVSRTPDLQAEPVRQSMGG
ncbi:hypothetical protein SAMN05216345_112140 [Cupriavidus sp. YR651]|uniref:hypothetical protein n=1 Tax=Cupriavidus sp. YR651 TaxID=1855315 RepID=UPI00088A3F9B|nr:hypothetical protein [Cupriavidus sp. YR651]SDD63906.1 hypothetical protein SAMN05216345_112140 [Cupriavidus sp. YR651]